MELRTDSIALSAMDAAFLITSISGADLINLTRSTTHEPSTKFAPASAKPCFISLITTPLGARLQSSTPTLPFSQPRPFSELTI